MKVAIVQEWLTTIGGSEKVVVEINRIYPNSDIYTLVANQDIVNELGLNNANVKTSFIQKFPMALKKWRSYLPFFPIAIEGFDLSAYDLIISSSHCVAKGVLTNSNQLHICYCHSPIRYAWDLHFQYLKESGLNKGLKGFLAKYILHRIRNWDIISVNRVDHFVSNSDYIGARIKKIYDRSSTTIYPCVAVSDFNLETEKDNYYIACSRMVPYKKMDLIVQAFAEMPDRRLVVIGDGPDMKKIMKVKGQNTEILGYQSLDSMRKYLAKAKAMVFAAEEDFGIVPVEAQACGTPVIAFNRGGVLESVIDGKTGIFFNEQTVSSIKEAVNSFELKDFDYSFIRQHAENFSAERFRKEFKAFVDDKIELRK